MHRWFFVILLVVMGLGCASSVRIADVNRPLSSLGKAIKAALPLGTKRVYEEGKRFQSHYFRLGKGKFLKASHSKVRYYSDVLIRGDRRPYSVDIRVVKQTRSQKSSVSLDSYVDVGTDPKLAEFVKRRILQELSKRREDSDVIDDFRVF